MILVSITEQRTPSKPVSQTAMGCGLSHAKNIINVVIKQNISKSMTNIGIIDTYIENRIYRFEK